MILTFPLNVRIDARFGDPTWKTTHSLQANGIAKSAHFLDSSEKSFFVDPNSDSRRQREQITTAYQSKWRAIFIHSHLIVCKYEMPSISIRFMASFYSKQKLRFVVLLLTANHHIPPQIRRTKCTSTETYVEIAVWHALKERRIL